MIAAIDGFLNYCLEKLRTVYILSILFFLPVGIFQQIKVIGLTLCQNQFDQLIHTLRGAFESFYVIVGIEEIQWKNKNGKSNKAISVGRYEVSSNRERFK